jgi:hypothetical protein
LGLPGMSDNMSRLDDSRRQSFDDNISMHSNLLKNKKQQN